MLSSQFAGNPIDAIIFQNGFNDWKWNKVLTLSWGATIKIQLTLNITENGGSFLGHLFSPKLMNKLKMDTVFERLIKSGTISAF